MKFLIVRFPLPLVGLAILLFIASCTKEPEPAPPVLEEKRIENQAYGDDSRHRMDIYLPKGRDEKTPVVVLLHGGFWTSRDKSDFTVIQQRLITQGIATVNLNYRYVSASNDYTGLMADVGAALTLVKNKASEWGIRDKGFHLAGASAGGYMALQYGYTASRPDEVRSVISIAGPVGLSPQLLAVHAEAGELLSTIEQLVGAPIPVDPEDLTDPSVLKYAAASPIAHLATAIPTLLIHGTEDELVPYKMATDMKAELDGAGVASQLVSLQGGKHDFSVNIQHVGIALTALSTWIEALEAK